MIANSATLQNCIVVAIDVAKLVHEVLVESPTGRRQRWRIKNCQPDYETLRDRLRALETSVLIGFEAMGNYHRPLAYYLGQCGFELCLISSLAVARTRDARYNSWDKNDPKDTQVLLHLLKTGVSQRYHDPLVHHMNDLQELAQTHYQISLRKVQVLQSIMTHSLPFVFSGGRTLRHELPGAVVYAAAASVSLSRRHHALFARRVCARGVDCGGPQSEQTRFPRRPLYHR